MFFFGLYCFFFSLFFSGYSIMSHCMNKFWIWLNILCMIKSQPENMNNRIHINNTEKSQWVRERHTKAMYHIQNGGSGKKNWNLNFSILFDWSNCHLELICLLFDSQYIIKISSFHPFTRGIILIHDHCNIHIALEQCIRTNELGAINSIHSIQSIKQFNS